MDDAALDGDKTKGSLAVLWRFLPMLWPRGEPELRVRVVIALVLVLAGKAIALSMPFAYKAIVDAMSGERQAWGAAAIMVFVFGSFLLENDRVLKLMGVGLASAILLDATIVRMLLVPATMALMGRANWWLPGWLDRVLPHINIDSDTTVQLPGQVPVPAPRETPVEVLDGAR